MNQILFSSATDLWATSPSLFNQLNQVFSFNLDVCALPENAKCTNYYSPEIDGLKQSWNGNCFCNPPYGKAIGQWVKIAYEESLGGNTLVSFCPTRTETQWFTYCWQAHYLIFLKRRVKFILNDSKKNSPTFPSVLVIFTDRDWDLSTLVEIRVVIDMKLQKEAGQCR